MPPDPSPPARRGGTRPGNRGPLPHRYRGRAGDGGWAGTCRAGLAEGSGAGRVRFADGEAGVFAGRARGGQGVSGIALLDQGASGWSP
ncbi:hypothetical protein ACVOMT_24375 (plasmid) [Sphingomonas panni]